MKQKYLIFGRSCFDKKIWTTEFSCTQDGVNEFTKGQALAYIKRALKIHSKEKDVKHYYRLEKYYTN